MKRIENANTFEDKASKMTLRDYFDSMPKSKWMAPRRDFISEVSRRCEVNATTVTNWISGRSYPQKSSYYNILSEITGIEPQDLFKSE